MKNKKKIAILTKALDFYANPDVYSRIWFDPDYPCGDFADDFSEVYDYVGEKASLPGKKARAALTKVYMRNIK